MSASGVLICTVSRKCPIGPSPREIASKSAVRIFDQQLRAAPYFPLGQEKHDFLACAGGKVTEVCRARMDRDLLPPFQKRVALLQRGRMLKRPLRPRILSVACHRNWVPCKVSNGRARQILRPRAPTKTALVFESSSVMRLWRRSTA